MRLTTQSPNQMFTVFGGSYIHEQHVDETHCNFLPIPCYKIGNAPKLLAFYSIVALIVAMAAVGAVALVASLALAGTLHKGAAAADQAYDAKTVVGPNGELIGVPADPRVRAELGQDGLPN